MAFSPYAPVADTNPLPVTVGSPSSTVTSGYSSSANFTRPNDTPTYDALDVVCNSTSAPAVMTFSAIGPTGGKVLLTRFRLRIDAAAVPAGQGAFRLHLYNASPTAINDQAAFDLPSGDRAKYLGFIESPTPLDLGATCWADTEAFGAPIRAQVTLVTDTLYGILQTVNSYTATASVVITCTLDAVAV